MRDLHITSVFGKRASENTGASFRHSNPSVHLRFKQSEVHMQATATDGILWERLRDTKVVQCVGPQNQIQDAVSLLQKDRWENSMTRFKLATVTRYSRRRSPSRSAR